MKRFLSWLVGVPVAVLLVAFAVANRNDVIVSFDPVSPQDPVLYAEAPLWGVLFAGIFLGLLAGWVAAWFNQRKWRRQARRAEHELKSVRHEKQELEKQRAATSDVRRTDLVPASDL